MQVLLMLLAASCAVCGDVHYPRYDTQARFDLLAAQAGIEDESERRAAFAVMWRESRGNPFAENRASSAAGLFGKMQSLHGQISACPVQQTRWANGYCSSRYGTWTAALKFHKKKVVVVG